MSDYEDKKKERLKLNATDIEEMQVLVKKSEVIRRKVETRNNQPELEAHEPNQSGSGVFAYSIEHSRDDGVTWKDMGIHRPDPKTGEKGIEGAWHLGNVCIMLDLMTYEQAQALAWMRRAEAAAVNAKKYKVRVVPYHLEYSIKSKRRIDLIKENMEA